MLFPSRRFCQQLMQNREADNWQEHVDSGLSLARARALARAGMLTPPHTISLTIRSIWPRKLYALFSFSFDLLHARTWIGFHLRCFTGVATCVATCVVTCVVTCVAVAARALSSIIHLCIYVYLNCVADLTFSMPVSLRGWDTAYCVNILEIEVLSRCIQASPGASTALSLHGLHVRM